MPAFVPERRRPGRWWSLTLVPGVLAVALVGAAFVRAPYFAFSPGDTAPSEALVHVDGAETYPTDGAIEFTTIGVRRLTWLGVVAGWLDPEVDVISEEDYLGDQTPEENKQENLRLMGFAKETAVYVALERLGYDVTVLGGGIVVTEVVEGSDAAAKLQRGDVIVQVDGTDIHLLTDLSVALEPHQPGDTVVLRVERPLDLFDQSKGVDTFDVDLVLARRDEDGRAIIGLQGPGIRDNLQFEFPIDVSIDSGNIGGPSAGLAFTLAVLDVLTPGELTGGNQVAVTGTIDLDGFVGPIGGIRQKTHSVMRSGARVFLVPEADYEIALDEAEGSELRIVQVTTLADALDALASIGGEVEALDAAPAG